MREQSLQKCQVLKELITTELLTNQVREFRVCLVKPSAWSDTICHIDEFISTKYCDEILEDGGLDEIWVELCYTIDLVRTDNSKKGHSDALRLTLFDDRHLLEQITVLIIVNKDGICTDYIAHLHQGTSSQHPVRRTNWYRKWFACDVGASVV